jgi:hypothetical protein
VEEKMNNSSADQEKLIEDATTLICDAFLHGHPGYREIVRIEDDDVALRKALYSFFSRHTRMLVSILPDTTHPFYESGDSTDGVKKLVCFFFLTPSDYQFSLWQKLCYGLGMIPLELGWQAFSRMLKAADFHEERMGKLLNGRKALVLERMVVSPECQGKGLGSKCLLEVLEKEADAQNLPVILSTQSMKNVNFYKKL